MAKDLFSADLVTAPAVEILLCLHAAEAEGRTLSGDELASRLRLSTETTNRWLRLLVARQLLTSVEVEPRSCAFYQLAPDRAAELSQLVADIGF